MILFCGAEGEKLLVKNVEDVEDFLKKVKMLVNDKDKARVNDASWADGKVNKTLQYKTEKGITNDVIRSVVAELNVEHYSSTQKDINKYFPNEEVWIFGITKNLVDEDENFYIKLKIKK